jgi:hypothetical protein
MSNVDVDIYISQVIRFFETHPDELKLLIGDLDKDDFFIKVKEISLKNHEKGDDAQLTRKQLLELVVEMNNEFKKKNKVDTIYYETIYGPICLN